jgi:hypothetical protein
MGSVYIPSPSGQQWPLNVQQRAFPYNEFDNCLMDDYALWSQIKECGGLQAICPGMKYAVPPWQKMPVQGKRFGPQPKSIALPPPTGVDVLIGSFLVPTGWDGTGTSIVFNYTGQGFQDGSGDLTWRLKLNQHYVKDYGAVTTQIGSLITPYGNSGLGQILLQSNQLVQFYINVSVASAGNLNGGRILAALFGWYYPRK